MIKSFHILNIKVTPCEPEELHKEISRLIFKGGPSFILSGNVHGINLARKIKWLADFYEKADIVRVDGFGIVLGARILGQKICKRLTWADWGWMLSKYLSQKGHSLYLLGGPKGVAQKAAKKLKKYADGLNILGTHHGYFKKEGAQNESVITNINKVKPDILIVAFGMPMQERWILANYKKIKSKIFITAGAGLEYLAGELKRCPKWMSETGLEWLFRLMLQPKRMGKRYLVGNSTFLIDVLRERAKNSATTRRD